MTSWLFLTTLLDFCWQKDQHPKQYQNKDPVLRQGLYFYSTKLILQLAGQGVADRAHGVVDLLAERGHNSNHDDGDEARMIAYSTKP